MKRRALAETAVRWIILGFTALLFLWFLNGGWDGLTPNPKSYPTPHCITFTHYKDSHSD